MRKISVILIVIIVQNFVLGQNDSLHLKERESFIKQCNEDKIRAINDSKTRTIYYINLAAPYDYDLLQKNELSEILKKYNIEFGGTWMGSDLAGFYTSESCYMITMTKIAIEKYGEEFFNEKINEALKIFIKKNPNKVFDYRTEKIDHSAKILGVKDEEQSKILKNWFWKKYKLPKDYISKKNEEYYSYILASFIIDQKGKISNIEVEAKIQNPDNQKHKEYFEKSFKEYIENLKWKPSIYNGFKVKNNVFSTIELP